MGKVAEQLYKVIRTRKSREALRMLETKRIDVHTGPYKPTCTFLHYAVQFGLIQVASKLLEMGSDVNLLDTAYRSRSPLMRALTSNHLSEAMVRLLLDAGANPNTKDNDGVTPVELAATFSSYTSNAERAKSLQLLIERGAKLGGTVGNRALEAAMGFPDAIEMLVKGGVKATRATLLDSAAREGDDHTFMLLWNAGVRFKEGSRKEPFLCVMGEGGKSAQRAAIAKFCILQGAAVNATKTSSPLIIACTYGHLDVARLLLAHGADVNYCFKGETALSRAAQYGYLEICKLLLESGADVHLDVHQDALRHAIARKYVSIATALIDADTPLGDGLLPLAVETGSPKLVRLLVQRGADPNRPASSGTLPLEVAIDKRRAEIAQWLLLNGGERTLSTKQGRTLQDLGERSKDEVIRTLFTLSRAKLRRYEVPKKSLVLSKVRRLLGESESRWQPHVKKQLKKMFGTNEKKALKQANEGGEVELVNVLDGASGKCLFQLYSYPYGDGTIFNHEKTTVFAVIVQHGLDITKTMKQDKKDETMEMLEEAFRASPHQLTHSIHFA